MINNKSIKLLSNIKYPNVIHSGLSEKVILEVFKYYEKKDISFEDMEFDLCDLPFNLFHEDIKDNFKTFDNKGVCKNIYQFLINEIWTSSYFGDWNNTIEYIGLINKNFKPDSIIEDKSLSKFKKRKEFENNLYLNFND